jgi:hypothetical protein
MEVVMKRFLVISFVLALFLMSAMAEDYVVKSVKGKAKVRHGVSEQWTDINVGDILKPEDTILTEQGGTTVLIKPSGIKLAIPEASMIDIVDLRNMSQDELLLKLAMENIRSVPSQKRTNDVNVPNTTIVHGADISKDAEVLKMAPREVGDLQIHGIEVLYNNSFYATGIIKSKSLMRLFPESKDEFTFRYQLAKAFEQVRLYDEALTEYVALSHEQLTKDQRSKLDKTIQQLKMRKGQ